jgi:hypothetical protein
LGCQTTTKGESKLESVAFEVVPLEEVVFVEGLTKGVYPVGFVVGVVVVFVVVDDDVEVLDGAEVVLMVFLFVESVKLGVVMLKSASHFLVMWGLQGSHSLVPSYDLIHT